MQFFGSAKRITMKLMKIPLTGSTLQGVALALAVGAVSSQVATAHPYATSLTNNAGIVSFRLNEDVYTNGSVRVVGNGGTLTNDLGTNTLRGLIVTNLTGSGMTGGLFRVEVTKAGAGVPTQISDNNNVNNQFESPRGVGVNKRPASANFGRVYVGNVRVGTTASGRPCQDGIYILNADSSDALGQGNTALTGGLNMVSEPISSIYALMPWRIRVGQDDDMLYLCNDTDNATNLPNLYRVDQDVTANSGTNVFGAYNAGNAVPPVTSANNHGSSLEVYVTGSLAGGNLTVYHVDEDYQTNPDDPGLTELNSLWRYDIGSANSGASFPWSNAPNAKLVTPEINFVAQTIGLDRGTNGYFYFLNFRSSGNENCLQIVDPAGPTVVYKSRDDSVNNYAFPRDILSNCVSVAVSPDMRFLALQRSSGIVVVCPLVNGIPFLGGRVEFTAIGSSARQIIFDAADNLYVISNNTERMRIYSLGMTTTAVTTSAPSGSGAGGTFSFAPPSQTISISSDTNVVYEAGATTATLTITRANDPLTSPVTVVFSTSGTATRGSDYVLKTNGVTFTTTSVVIPAGQSTLNVTLTAVDDAVAELTETATLTIVGSTAYSPDTSFNTTTVAIVDNEPATADITVTQSTMFEQNTNDYCTFRVTRRGDTNAASFTVNLNYSGVAGSNVDYVAVPTVTVNPGDVNVDFRVNPIDDTLLEGTETFTISVAAGSGYNIGTNSPSATGAIRDDELPSATVLLYDEFNIDTSGNYTLKFASGNGIDDYTTNWVYDYSADGIPTAPNGADSFGLKVTVNKNEASALGGAGINLYPTGRVFSNNYALRFDMFLIVGSGSFTTEYASFGINHDGNHVNWFRNNGDGVGAANAGASQDGIWCYIEADGAALGDYVMNTAPVVLSGGLYDPTSVASRGAATLAAVFKSPPWQGTSGAGAPANLASSTTLSWAQVQLAQIGNVVTLNINATNIMSFTNNTAAKVGTVMIGYDDAYDSVGSDGAVIFDNLKVVDLGRPNITSIAVVGTNAVMKFTWTLDEATSVFAVQRANVVSGPYADVAGATITKLSPGVYQATAGRNPATGSANFYRIRR